MKIPDKIRIGGQDIYVVNEERHSNNLLGEICVAEEYLILWANLSCRGTKSLFVRFLHCWLTLLKK